LSAPEIVWSGQLRGRTAPYRVVAWTTEDGILKTRCEIGDQLDAMGHLNWHPCPAAEAYEIVTELVARLIGVHNDTPTGSPGMG